MKWKRVLFEDQEQFILEYAMKQGNFSKYVKSLIATDMRTQKPKPSIYEIYNERRG